MSALQQQQQQSTSATEQQSPASDQQQLQQQQQQYAAMMAAQQAQAQMQATAPMVESGVGGPPPLSSLQQQQLQQLQFQQMQWQYLQQMQMQQHYLQQQQQQQQQAQGATFNPADGGVAQSTGASRYRSAYQSYGNYPSDDQQQQQQMVQLDSSGNPLGGTLPPLADNRLSIEQRGDGLTAAQSGSGSVRARKSHHEPSVDPNAWNSSIAYPSKSNPDRYLAHRSFFSDIPPVVNRLPRKPELKALVLKGRDFYNNNRDPWHYNPTKESGWDNRAAIIKQPITAGPLAIGATAFKFEKQGTSTGAGAAHGSSALLQQSQQSQQQQLPSVEEAKEQFSTFPVLLQPNSARPDSKLLLPFLSHWPPPFRFDYLRKHSRAPLSPFLASVHGYDVPPEMFLSARQLKEVQRAQMEQMGYDADYSQQQQQQQWGFDPSQQQGQGQQHHSNDPVERARARANTHTTYWRTVPPEGIDPATARDVAHGQAHGGPVPPKSHRPEWNFRHHVKPPEPRVGQTTAKKPTGRSARHRAQLQQQQQMQQQQQQQQQALMHAQLMSGQHLPPLMYGPGADGQMQQQQMMMMQPYGQFPPFPPMADIDPAVLAHFQQMQLQQQQQQQQDWQQQQQWMMQQQQEQEQDQQQQQHGDEEQQHSEQQQAAQQRFDEQQQQQQQQQQQRYEQQQHDQQQQQQQDHDRELHESAEQHGQPQATSDPPKHGASHPPPSDGAAAPTLNPHAQSHVKDVYNQLYHANDATTTLADQAAHAPAAADQ